MGPLALRRSHDRVALEDRQGGRGGARPALRQALCLRRDAAHARGARRPGKRYGKGFYEYPQDGRKFLWPGLKDAFPAAPEQPTVEELKKRLLYIQSLETARCLEEGVLTHPADADVGSLLAWGFPSWTGGTLADRDRRNPTFRGRVRALGQRIGPRFLPSQWLKERAAKGEAFYPARTAAEVYAMRRLIFDTEHESFRDAVRRFFQNEIAPHTGKWREQGFVDRWAFTKTGEQGYLLMWADEEYGGAGIDDFRFEQIVMEENMRHGETGFYVQLHSDLVAPYIDSLGHREQKRAWLPGAVRGEKILAVAMTEPGSGSDLAGMKSTAQDRGDHWLSTARRPTSRTDNSPTT